MAVNPAPGTPMTGGSVTADDLHTNAAIGVVHNDFVQRAGRHFAKKPTMNKPEFDGHLKDAHAAHGLQASETEPTTIDDGGQLSVNLDQMAEGLWSRLRKLMSGEGHKEPQGFAEMGVVESDGGDHYRVFVPAQFSEVGEWIPYLPKPGTYRHPRAGTLQMSAATNQRIVENFQAGVYQDVLPLDVEHQTKMSGAMAWIKELRLNEDGSVDARVDWTERGRSMVKGGGFRYISPEIFLEWPDPATGKVHRGVAAGGALTTRPFFKPSHLRPLVASEEGFAVPGDDDALISAIEQRLSPTGQEGRMTGNETPQDVQARVTELESKLAAAETERDEAKSKLAEATTTSTTFSEQNTALMERLDKIERERRVEGFRLTASEFIGDIDEHVEMLETLDDDRREKYIQREKALAAQLKTSDVFKEYGRSGTDQTSDPLERLSAAAKAIQAKDPAKSEALAFTEACEQNPRLYDEYLDAQRVRS